MKIDAIYGQGVKTRYVGATSSRGSRIIVSPLGRRGRGLSVPYNHALGTLENHEAAAAKALGARKLSCTEAPGGRGFYFIQRK
jgi:hypothetical protein